MTSSRSRRLDDSVGPSLERGTRVLVLLCLGAATLFTLAFQSQSIAFPHQRNYGEAPLLDQAMRLANGDPLYRPDLASAPFTVSNYPPLFIALLAPLTQVFGPAFWYGRLLSSLAGCAAAIFLGLVIFEHTRDRFASVLTASIFLSFPIVRDWSGLARVDLLALAWSTSALWVLSRRPTERTSLLVSAALLLAAIYTRQTHVLAGPLAAVIWVWATAGWRRAAGLASLLTGLTLAAFGVLELTTSGGFSLHVVTANVNTFVVDRTVRLLGGFLRSNFIAVCFGVAAAVVVRRFGDARAMLVPYGLAALVSAATIGKVGSSFNYVLELCAALSLAGGIVIAWSRQHCSWRLVRATAYCALIAQTASFASVTFDSDLPRLQRHWRAQEELDTLQALVADAPGPVLIDELMGVLPLTGRRIELQPFEMTQLARAGRWDDAPLVDAIRRKRFAVVAMAHLSGKWDTGFWTPAVLRAIEDSYEPRALLAGSVIMGPRR